MLRPKSFSLIGLLLLPTIGWSQTAMRTQWNSTRERLTSVSPNGLLLLTEEDATIRVRDMATFEAKATIPARDEILIRHSFFLGNDRIGMIGSSLGWERMRFYVFPIEGHGDADSATSAGTQLTEGTVKCSVASRSGEHVALLMSNWNELHELHILNVPKRKFVAKLSMERAPKAFHFRGDRAQLLLVHDRSIDALETWDFMDDRILSTSGGFVTDVEHASLSLAGDYLAVMGKSGSRCLAVWDSETLRPVRGERIELSTLEFEPNALRWSAKARSMFATCGDGGIAQLDRNNGCLKVARRFFGAHASRAWFSNNSQLVSTDHSGRSLHKWDVRRDVPTMTFATSIRFSEPSKHGTAIVRFRPRRKELAFVHCVKQVPETPAYTSRITHAVFQTAADQVAHGGQVSRRRAASQRSSPVFPEGTVVMLDYATSTIRPRLLQSAKLLAPGKEEHLQHENEFSAISCSSDSRFVAGVVSGSYVVWDIDSAKIVMHSQPDRYGWLSRHDRSVAFAPRSNLLAIGAKGHFGLLDVDKQTGLGQWSCDSSNVIGFLDDRSVIASNAIIDASNGQPIVPMPELDYKAKGVSNGTHVVSLSNGAIFVTDSRTALTEQPFHLHRSEVSRIEATDVAICKNSVATGDTKGTIRIWNLSTGSLVRRLSGHTAKILSLDFSRDGRQLVSCSLDGTICLWNDSSQQTRIVARSK